MVTYWHETCKTLMAWDLQGIIVRFSLVPRGILPRYLHPLDAIMLIKWRDIRSVRVLRQFLAEYQGYPIEKQEKLLSEMRELIEEQRLKDIQIGVTHLKPRQAEQPVIAPRRKRRRR